MKHECKFDVGPENRCEMCGIRKVKFKKAPRVVLTAAEINDPHIPSITVPKTCSYKIEDMNKELRGAGDKLYAEGLEKLVTGKDAKVAAKLFKEAYDTFVKAKDGVAAALSVGFTEEYCKGVMDDKNAVPSQN